MGTENVTPSQDVLPRKRRRQICSINPSPAAISKLGDDLLVEILIRLPNPGSACRSKSVCKLWNSLVSDPSFNRRSVSRRQSINEQEPPLLLPSDDPQSIVLRFLPVPAEAREYFRVLDSFKDLVLCGFREAYSYRMKEEFSRLYLVCNPFTKQWIALPLAPFTRQDASSLWGMVVECFGLTRCSSLGWIPRETHGGNWLFQVFLECLEIGKQS
ncbi:unnamed protein product [Linum trigynum]|uniref:F-box domain-containing protein n=1 Tax=Linum trigynum TaxID=586398 RepID=A0AAV2G3G9_9ROSI